MPFNRFTPAGINVKSRWNIFLSTNFITEQPNGIHLQSKRAKWIVYWWWTRIDRNIVLYYFPREMVLGRNGWRSLVGGDRKMITKLRGKRTNWTNRIFLFATSVLWMEVDLGCQYCRWCMKDIFNKSKYSVDKITYPSFLCLLFH